MKTDELIEQYQAGERDFSKANLRWANLTGADLSKANLSGANLSKADLSKAYLIEANLIGANLSWAVGNGNEIKTLIASKYHVVWTAHDMSIGCEQHPIAEWWEFDDARISKMAHDAVEWWAKWKPALKMLISQ